MKNSSARENVFLTLGLLFILSGIVFNEWAVTSLFSADGVITLSRRIIIWFFDISVIVLGIYIIIKRKVLQYKKFIYGFILIFIMLFVIEAGLHVTYLIINSGKQDELDDKRYLTKPYSGKEWAKDLFREYEALKGEYKEYRGWGKKEFEGRYVNINAEGMRKTWNPENFQERESKKIFIFGGSTIWGDGARDDYTIPSYISKELNKRGYDNFTVYNYGEWAYTYTQEIIHLILLLREGNIPDYVIFYDGIADIYGAYQGGVPGHLHYSFSLRDKMKKKEMSPLAYFVTGITKILDKYSKIYGELVKINKKLDPPEADFMEIAHQYDDERLKKLSEGVFENYLKSLKLLDNLSKAYGFKYICFWQPVSFTEEGLSDEDLKIDVRFKDKSLIKLHRYTRDYLRTRSVQHFYDISGVLGKNAISYYIDFAHISEEGNAVVADKMVTIFEKEYLADE